MSEPNRPVERARTWPWWTPVAALAVSIVFCGAVWVGVGNLAGVAVRYADARAKEGTWSREAFFEGARNLTTGRSVSRIKVDPTPPAPNWSPSEPKPAN